MDEHFLEKTIFTSKKTLQNLTMSFFSHISFTTTVYHEQFQRYGNFFNINIITTHIP